MVHLDTRSTCQNVYAKANGKCPAAGPKHNALLCVPIALMQESATNRRNQTARIRAVKMPIDPEDVAVEAWLHVFPLCELVLTAGKSCSKASQSAWKGSCQERVEICTKHVLLSYEAE